MMEIHFDSAPRSLKSFSPLKPPEIPATPAPAEPMLNVNPTSAPLAAPASGVTLEIPTLSADLNVQPILNAQLTKHVVILNVLTLALTSVG